MLGFGRRVDDLMGDDSGRIAVCLHQKQGGSVRIQRFGYREGRTRRGPKARSGFCSLLAPEHTAAVLAVLTAARRQLGVCDGRRHYGLDQRKAEEPQQQQRPETTHYREFTTNGVVRHRD